VWWYHFLFDKVIYRNELRDTDTKVVSILHRDMTAGSYLFTTALETCGSIQKGILFV